MKINEKKQLIEKLRRFKEANELTLEDLGHLLGTHSLTVQRWLRGKNLPSRLAVGKIQEFLENAKRGEKWKLKS
jgi:transcriptional regulator with XRE-family HTH domain